MCAIGAPEAGRTLVVESTPTPGRAPPPNVASRPTIILHKQQGDRHARCTNGRAQTYAVSSRMTFALRLVSRFSVLTVRAF